MTKYQGQTDQPLVIKLPSAIVSAKWLHSSVAAGGKVTCEVETKFIADASPIRVTLFDGEGKKLTAFEGKVFSNLHRRIIDLPIDITTRSAYFEAELSKHSLKTTSPKIEVVPPVVIKNMRWLDGKDQVLSVMTHDHDVLCEAAITGAKPGERATVRVFQTRGELARLEVVKGELPIEAGKVRYKWRHGETTRVETISMEYDVNRDGKHYLAPKYVFEVEVLGTKAESTELSHESWLDFDFGQAPEGMPSRSAEFEMADGSQLKESVPENGKVRIKQVKPGSVHFKGLKVG